MKKLLILTAIAIMILPSCKVSQNAYSADDVYVNPTEEREKEKLAAAEKAKADALEQQRIRDEQLAQKAKDDANPYYKDPEYNRDDYYDYQYASRVNRFQSPIYGAGYYDPYYTNLYTYNQNPACYGTSIYSTYNYGMPSSQFNYYSVGVSTGWGYGGYGCNNFGYNGFGYGVGYSYGYPGYYNDPFYSPYGFGYNNWGYSSAFYNGYNAGYYNGYNNGSWGYYNSYDPNSGYNQVRYAPRNSTGGGNSRPGAANGMDESQRSSYFKSVADQQDRVPRFSNSRPNDRSSGTGYSNTSGNGGTGSSDRVLNNQRGQNNRNSEVQGNNNNTNSRQNDRVTNRNKDRNTNENNNSGNRSDNSGWNNSNSNSGGNSGGGRGSGSGGGGGRSSGGGGNTRPR